MKQYIISVQLGVGLLSVAGLFSTAQAQVPAPPTESPRPAATAPGANSGSSSALLAPGAASDSPYKAYLKQHYAGDKSAQAVIHLFARKQTGGVLWALGGTAAIAYVASQTGTHTSDSGTTTVSVSPLGYGILVGLTAGIGGRKLIRFSNQKLYEALLMHEQSKVFPQYVQDKLKDKDYE